MASRSAGPKAPPPPPRLNLQHVRAAQLNSNHRRMRHWAAHDAAISAIQKKSLALSHSLNHLFQERLFKFNPSEPPAPAYVKPINLATYCTRLASPDPSCDTARREIPDVLVRKFITDLGYVLSDARQAGNEKCIGLLVKLTDAAHGGRWVCMAKSSEICGARYGWSLVDSIWRNNIVCGRSTDDLFTYLSGRPGHGILNILSVNYERGAYYSRAVSRVVPPKLVTERAATVANSLYTEGNNDHSEAAPVENDENNAGAVGPSVEEAAAAEMILRRRQITAWVKEYLEPVLRENGTILAMYQEQLEEFDSLISERRTAAGARGLSVKTQRELSSNVQHLERQKSRAAAEYEAKAAELAASYEAEFNRLVALQLTHNNTARSAGQPLSKMLLNPAPQQPRAAQPSAAQPRAAQSRPLQPPVRFGFPPQQQGTRKHGGKRRNQTRCRNRFHH